MKSAKNISMKPEIVERIGIGIILRKAYLSHSNCCPFKVARASLENFKKIEVVSTPYLHNQFEECVKKMAGQGVKHAVRVLLLRACLKSPNSGHHEESST
jgi:hypothetical protein